MRSTKFKFNEKTLRNEEVKITWRDRLRKAGIHIGFSAGLALAFIVISYPIVRHVIISDQIEELDKVKEEYTALNSKTIEMQKVVDVLVTRDDSVYTSIFGTAPVSRELRLAGTGGTDKFDHLRGYSNSDLMLRSAALLDALESQVKMHEKSFKRIEKLNHARSEKLSHVPGIQPIHNHNLIRTASGFGKRFHPVYHVWKMHTGIDFTAKVGTKIFATGDGVVSEVKRKYTGYGKHVIVDHGFGYKSLYAHMSKFAVKPGQKVKRGDLLGYVGNTGTSTGPHLHYEVIKNGKKIDPANFFFNDLTFEQYREMIKISSNSKTSLD